MKNFYDSFFLKKSFLSQNAKFTSIDEINAKGFKDIDLKNKKILEIGAGSGRLTNALINYKSANKAKKYYLLEPSKGIENLEPFTHKYSNIEIINDNLENIMNYLKEQSLDIIIAHGVIPHINLTLDEIFFIFKKLLNEKGEIYVSSSYYSSEKYLAKQLKKNLSKNIIIFKLLSFFTALLQILFNILPTFFYKFYILNFHYSYQKKFKDIYMQQLEYYSVFPYNINYSYNNYKNSCVKNEFYINSIYPNSISFVASKKNNYIDFNFLKKFTFYNHDWHTKYVIKKMKLREYEIINEIDNLNNNNIIILSYDFTKNVPYYKSVIKFEKNGFIFGKNLFTYHYFI